MSLRPADHSGRSRSKSRERSRSRSAVDRSSAYDVESAAVAAPPPPAPMPGPPRSRSPMPGGFDGGVPQYEIREPGGVRGREGSVSGPAKHEQAAQYAQYDLSDSSDDDSEDEEPAATRAPASQTPYGYSSNVFAYAEPQSPNSSNRPSTGQSQFPAYRYAQPSDFASMQAHAHQYGHQGREDGASQRQPSYKIETREPSALHGVKSSAKDMQYPYATHPAYANMPHTAAAAAMPDYKNASGYQYAQMPESIKYTAKPQTKPGENPAQAKQAQEALQYQQYQQYHQYQQLQQQQLHQQQQIKEEKRSKKHKKKDKESRKSRRHEDSSDEAIIKPPKSPMLAARPTSSRHGSYNLAEPADLSKKMHRLSVSGNRPDMQALGAGQLPPASPLLEAYHGTYQSLSPMPSPMLLANDGLDDIPPLSPISKPRKKSGRIASAAAASGAIASGAVVSGAVMDMTSAKHKVLDYDVEEDTEALVGALTGTRVDADTLIDILPELTHEELLAVRREYKKQCKVQGHGINLAKHVKLKIPTTNFGKICYITALGRWQSEAEWANFWYQSNNARRELLIEALMGRPNAEIRAIKDAFKDKRYGNSLERCMDKELKADKFRQSVMWVLSEHRQEENDVWHVEHRNRDVETLYSAVRRREGGETTMLQIVILRSDAHLREVLKTYERMHGANFARVALQKSNNLVGEVIAHVLNGVINRPARDAMLLRHALEDLQDTPRSSSTRQERHEKQDRYELLISRLVRLHWDRMHMARVKSHYRQQYRCSLDRDIEDATKGDFREFCLQLCKS